MNRQEARCNEISLRIRADLTHFNGVMPERNTIAWRAYLAALLEWDVIGLEHYDGLVALLPTIGDDPAQAILLGRDTGRELATTR